MMNRAFDSLQSIYNVELDALASSGLDLQSPDNAVRFTTNASNPILLHFLC